MIYLVAVRYEDIEFIADDFIMAVAENFLKLGIDQDNFILRINKKHGIRR